jgi:Protein of unknown function (DUF1566)
MKIPSRTVRFSACATLALYCPWTLAQTCVAGIQASNPTSTYVINGVTVTDSRTGLMWDRCELGLSGSSCATGTTSLLTWQGALDAAANVGTYKGYNDWRLPNLKELRSLVEECRLDPSINEFAFPNTTMLIPVFWSSSPIAGSVAYSSVVNFKFGTAGFGGHGNGYRVRFVRAGQ